MSEDKSPHPSDYETDKKELQKVIQQTELKWTEAVNAYYSQFCIPNFQNGTIWEPRVVVDDLSDKDFAKLDRSTKRMTPRQGLELMANWINKLCNDQKARVTVHGGRLGQFKTMKWTWSVKDTNLQDLVSGKVMSCETAINQCNQSEPFYVQWSETSQEQDKVISAIWMDGITRVPSDVLSKLSSADLSKKSG